MDVHRFCENDYVCDISLMIKMKIKSQYKTTYCVILVHLTWTSPSSTYCGVFSIWCL